MYLVSTTSGNKQYILRPELTASVARIALEHNWSHQLPKRVWYHGALFRHERPQKGRFRQFYQLGIEYMGSNDIQGDVEVLYTGVQLIKSITNNLLDIEVG